MDLSNRTVLVTGGTGGIGLGIAGAFLQSGSIVIVCGRNKEKLSRVKLKYPGIIALNCDLGDAKQREKLAADVIGSYPGLDILVNNAGIQRYIDLKKGYEEIKSGEDEIVVNFTAVVELTALFIGHLMKKPSAAIINVSSRLGFMPVINLPVYCATKAAVHTFSLVLRRQMKDTSVKVIEIVPPMVDTDLNKQGRDSVPGKFRGISLSEYIPSVVEGLESNEDTIFYEDGKKLATEPRNQSENRLLSMS